MLPPVSSVPEDRRGPATVCRGHAASGEQELSGPVERHGPLGRGALDTAATRRNRVARFAEVVGAAYVSLTIVLLLAGELVMELAVGSWAGAVDSAITHWFARNRGPIFNTLTTGLSNLGDTFTVIGVALGAGTVLLAARLWRQATVLAVGLAVELSVFLSTTYVVHRPRPDVDALDSVPATASFPSGHMAASVVLYGGLALIGSSLVSRRRVRRWLLIAAGIIAVGVGVSRVYRGLHYPSDIVAGGALGLACLAAAVVAARFLPAGGWAARRGPRKCRGET